jgi:hypothetical protein
LAVPPASSTVEETEVATDHSADALFAHLADADTRAIWDVSTGD